MSGGPGVLSGGRGSIICMVAPFSGITCRLSRGLQGVRFAQCSRRKGPAGIKAIRAFRKGRTPVMFFMLNTSERDDKTTH